ncbi:D-glycero-beta-D-manno-heptose 1-phosphate adenylyltransferase [Pseudoclavibacter sp. AY1F1]|uniref:D-glycero-beta-D-manno-heptose 1-phosphate adenylyltransferase n=1 Tax=Pseudoclavibacter sp. AY1F1 TaxID=2080583 RepID=UPI000CE72FC8|nr:D-glycero-beta-D-manno-heptose 1-phosphate adenylyltransferase [Pseudoclavibacter sp. AY1F1]PPF42699.1 D-glycero-beta-D-manno-heptose 1-phosphate adenylyltransferase [Pseudoclavibacter sp. AY1F1]
MRITVVGDTLLDEDLDGSATRLAPDAPVPVVQLDTRTHRAGGAGLVATLLAGDGHDVELVTVLSDDAAARTLRASLAGVRVVAGSSNAPTPVKTRVHAAGHALARIDDGCAPPPPVAATPEMLSAIVAADAVLVADYGRGVTRCPEIRAALDSVAGRAALVWDPHPRGERPVAAATLVTPNLAEASGLTGQTDPAVAAALLLGRWGCDAVAVTLGERGALLARSADGAAEGEQPVALPAEPVQAADTCGAGDRFAATAVTRIAAGDGLEEAVRAAIDAAGAFLRAGGVASIVRPKPHPSPGPDASAGPDTAAEELIASVRARGGTVVATGGCFDLLHAGHVRTLETARGLGDCLIVCLNSDDSVRRLKGEQRPIIGEADRVELLSALRMVDAVVVFEEDSPETLLARLRPDVWVKGGDYSVDALPETKLLAEWGGRTVTVPFHLGHSTTSLAAALAAVG